MCHRRTFDSISQTATREMRYLRRICQRRICSLNVRAQRCCHSLAACPRLQFGCRVYSIVAFTVMTDLPEPCGPFPSP